MKALQKTVCVTLTFLGLLLTLSACGESAVTPTIIVSNPTSVPTTPTTNNSTPLATNTVAATSTTSSTTVALPTNTPLATATPIPAHTIVIDPGHGGIDWGTFHTNASNKIDLKEKDAVLPIALKTADLLRADGYKVVLTRTTDKYFNDKDYNGDGKIDMYDDLQARVDIANENKADLFFSIHTNASELKNQVGGVETWWGSDRPFSDQSRRFSDLIQKYSISSLKSIGYDALDRGSNDDLDLAKDGTHIFVLGPTTRNHSSVTNMPGALTEILFVTNDTEATLLQETKAINAIAGGYTKAIEEYFNKPPAK